jgi:preprotein translocase subunit SecY
MQNSTFRESIEFFLVIAVGIIALVVTIYWNSTHPRITVRYDCSIAEISPDYPVAVKEGCRKLRAENILQKPK